MRVLCDSHHRPLHVSPKQNADPRSKRRAPPHPAARLASDNSILRRVAHTGHASKEASKISGPSKRRKSRYDQKLQALLSSVATKSHRSTVLFEPPASDPVHYFSPFRDLSPQPTDDRILT
ncbi:hypothetical protein HPP92_026828 [Vanilla planifolia]|uniref:Uncharacterized protein n=1 Tax=Vanilla planifolia TaxID=51239 RepID=A0A835U5C0_VANPL|nr:hypothetical protein HPP92_027016 [Vanilla planifolia]KAG0450302.1 hypothetical protein HPP92_026828 [Vanilla planifolia]